jgi:hypothetical protein
MVAMAGLLMIGLVKGMKHVSRRPHGRAGGGFSPLLLTVVSVVVVVVPPGVEVVCDSFTFAVSPQPETATATAAARVNARIRFMIEISDGTSDLAAHRPSAGGIRTIYGGIR